MENYQTISKLSSKKSGESINNINEGKINLSNIQIDQINEKLIKTLFKIIKINYYRFNLFCKKCENLLAVFYKFKNEETRIIFLRENILFERGKNVFEKKLDFIKYKNYTLQYLKYKNSKFENELKNDIIPLSIKFNNLNEKIDSVNNLLKDIKIKLSIIMQNEK